MNCLFRRDWGPVDGQPQSVMDAVFELGGIGLADAQSLSHHPYLRPVEALRRRDVLDPIAVDGQRLIPWEG